MRFLHGTVKARKGDTVTVSVSQATRILIMTKKQYHRYKDNLTFTYFGGQKDAEYAFKVPRDGEWHVIVEKGSYSNPLSITAGISKEAGVPEEKGRKKKKKDKKKKKELEAVAEESTENVDDAEDPRAEE